MVALPIVEVLGKSWSSNFSGKIHTCGVHDRHKAMLLSAAKHLSRTRKFKGSAALIFQPAEEVELPSAALKMVQDGFLDRLNIAQAGTHNKAGYDWLVRYLPGPDYGIAGRLRHHREGQGRPRPASSHRTGPPWSLPHRSYLDFKTWSYASSEAAPVRAWPGSEAALKVVLTSVVSSTA